MVVIPFLSDPRVLQAPPIASIHTDTLTAYADYLTPIFLMYMLYAVFFIFFQFLVFEYCRCIVFRVPHGAASVY